MLPLILVAVGAYLIGDSVLEDKKYAKGGKTEEKLAEYLVTLIDKDGFEDDVVVMAKSEDDALYQAEKIKGYESSENGVVMLTDFDGNKIEYKKGGKTQGYDDKEDERLAMEQCKMSKKDLDSTHARRDDARFEERGKMAKGGKVGYTNKFQEVNDGGNESYYIRKFGVVEDENDKKIDLVVVANIKDLEDWVSEDELPEDGNFLLSITLVPLAKYMSKDKLEEANDYDSSAISDNSEVNVVNYMGGLNYNPEEQQNFKTLKDALKYLHSKELNDKISNDAKMAEYILDNRYNRAGSTNLDYLNYMTGISERFAKGGKLVGKQKKLDVNKNGKLDAEDFKMLRGDKMAKGGAVKRPYKLGDMWRTDFDYEGMLKQGLKSKTSWGEAKLQKLFDSFEDVNYHTAGAPLWDAIKSLENGNNEEAEKHIEEFHKRVKSEMDGIDFDLKKGGKIMADAGETKMSYKEFEETLREYEIEGGFGKTIEKGYEMYYLPKGNPYLNTKFNHRNKKKAYQQYVKMDR